MIESCVYRNLDMCSVRFVSFGRERGYFRSAMHILDAVMSDSQKRSSALSQVDYEVDHDIVGGCGTCGFITYGQIVLGYFRKAMYGME